MCPDDSGRRRYMAMRGEDSGRGRRTVRGGGRPHSQGRGRKALRLYNRGRSGSP